jgi:hypothetical protein
MTRVAAVLASLLLLVATTEAQSPNLIQNPGFTSNLGNWTVLPSPSYTVSWDGSVGNAAPGSALIDMPSTPAGTTSQYFLKQCVPVAAQTAYDVGGSFFYPSSVTTVPASGILFYPHATTDCSGAASGGSDFGLSVTSSPADTWLTTTYARGLVTPAGAASVLVYLRFTTTAVGAAHGWYDDLRLTASPLQYYTLSPCRVVDTRDLGAPIGGPVLQGQETRSFAVGGKCGIPSSAKVLSLNVTATQATAQGNVALFPAGEPVPTVSTINYVAGQTRANNAIVSLDPSGAMDAYVGQPAGTTVHLVIDVNGYFQ